MKTNVDKRVNKIVKQINKNLREDVFKDRFWVRQYQKANSEGLQYYLYELMDREEPIRNYVISKWIWGESQFFITDIYQELNDFIIKSNFWSKFYNDETRYNEDIDVYKKRGEYEKNSKQEGNA